MLTYQTKNKHERLQFRVTKRGKTPKVSNDAFDCRGEVGKLLVCELPTEHAQATIRGNDEALRFNVLKGGRQGRKRKSPFAILTLERPLWYLALNRLNW